MRSQSLPWCSSNNEWGVRGRVGAVRWRGCDALWFLCTLGLSTREEPSQRRLVSTLMKTWQTSGPWLAEHRKTGMKDEEEERQLIENERQWRGERLLTQWWDWFCRYSESCPDSPESWCSWDQTCRPGDNATGRSRTLYTPNCCWPECSAPPGHGGHSSSLKGISSPLRSHASSPPTGSPWTDRRFAKRQEGKEH